MLIQKVMIIGNGGGGKTTLAYQLAAQYALPLHEIDALQFQPGWIATPEPALRQTIEQIQQTDRWLIDGFGPWELIEARARLADTIIFVDHPIWVHFWWACERQIAAALGTPRLGGPPACDLRDVTKRMFETLWWCMKTYVPNWLVWLNTIKPVKQWYGFARQKNWTHL